MGLLIIFLILVLSFHNLYETPAETQERIFSTRTAKTLYVGPNQTYTSIQAAINDSVSGDTIFVYNGTYHEQLVIDKNITLIGESPESTIINLWGEDEGVYIVRSQVKLSGFTLSGDLDGARNTAGILLNVVNNSTFTNNRIIGSVRGIYSRNSDNNMFRNIEFINNFYGILFEFSHENIIENNIITNNSNSLYFSGSWGNYISNNSIFENDYGIRFFTDSNFNEIVNNTIYSTRESGIYISDWSKNNSIINNTFFENKIPVEAFQCNANQILNNNCSNNSESMSISLSYDILIMNNIMTGIDLSTCINISISNNTMTGGGISIDAELLYIGYLDWWESIACWNSHNIDTSNIVNGKPVLYWKDRVGGVVPPNAGQIILGNCSEVTIVDQNIENCTAGIILGFSDLNYIKNCTLSDNEYGLFLTSSKNNSIINNSFNDNYQGIKLYSKSNENLIINNTFQNNSIAIDCFYDSDKNSIENNNFSKNNAGVFSYYCMDNRITNNTFYNITVCDIYLQSSSGYVLFNNTMARKGILLEGYHVSSYNSHIISPSNTVSGKPIYYYSGQSNIIVPAGAGQIILANCSNIKVEKQNLSGRVIGLIIGHSAENVIIDNIFSSNDQNGIRIVSSQNNTIKNNLVHKNKNNGISIEQSNANEIIDNEITSNHRHGVHLSDSRENIIKNNRIFSNHGNGIDVFQSDQNFIEQNYIKYNDQNGLQNYYSDSNKIDKNNIFQNNWSGIALVHADNNKILHNFISHNKNIGINISGYFENFLLNNTISYHEYGLTIYGGVHTRVLFNYFLSNTIGIEIHDRSGDKVYYNNFINNEIQAIDDKTNEWNYYYPYGGNYWNDYQGVDEFSGPNQNIPGSDGIGDSPYIINQKTIPAQDQYPLMAPVTSPDDFNDFLKLSPMAPENLRMVVGSGFVNLTWDPPRSEGLLGRFSYVIYRGTNIDELFDSVGYKYNIGPGFNDTDVKGGVTYYYRITAENEAGESSSEIVNATIPETAEKNDSSQDEPVWYRNLFLVLLLILLILFVVFRLMSGRKSKSGKKE